MAGIRGHGWGQRPWMGSEAMAGVRGHGWGHRPWLGSEAMAGVTGHGWGHRPWLGSEVMAGVRGHGWDQRSKLGSEAMAGVRGHGWDQRPWLGSEVMATSLSPWFHSFLELLLCALFPFPQHLEWQGDARPSSSSFLTTGVLPLQVLLHTTPLDPRHRSLTE